jgi:hypothetical protein
MMPRWLTITIALIILLGVTLVGISPAVDIPAGVQRTHGSSVQLCLALLLLCVSPIFAIWLVQPGRYTRILQPTSIKASNLLDLTCARLC